MVQNIYSAWFIAGRHRLYCASPKCIGKIIIRIIHNNYICEINCTCNSLLSIITDSIVILISCSKISKHKANSIFVISAQYLQKLSPDSTLHSFSLQSSTLPTVQGLAHEQPVSVWQTPKQREYQNYTPKPTVLQK